MGGCIGSELRWGVGGVIFVEVGKGRNMIEMGSRVSVAVQDIPMSFML